MPISCDVDDLAEAAKCFQQCIPKGLSESVKILLLQNIAGNTETPAELMESAKCIHQCVPKGFEGAIIIYLLCAIANQ